MSSDCVPAINSIYSYIRTGLVVVFILWNLFLCLYTEVCYAQLKFLLTHKKNKQRLWAEVPSRALQTQGVNTFHKKIYNFIHDILHVVIQASPPLT